MPRNKMQRAKLLYIKQFFEEMTDDDHPATIRDIIAYLEKNGVPAERKGIYDDLDALAEFGMDVRDEDGKPGVYRWSNRNIKKRELKLIIDSVASSAFLSEKESDNLIKRLSNLCSVYEQKELRRQVHLLGRAKTMNTSAINVLDHIHNAIAKNTAIRFKYFHYNIKKERELYKTTYEVSPWALLYDNGKYYLLAYDGIEFKTFRVDKMTSVAKCDIPRQGQEQFEKVDIRSYFLSSFNMYGGKEESVDMVFQNRMLDTVIDKFGNDIWLQKKDNNHFKVTVKVKVSPQFFAWVFGLGNYVTITGPSSVVKQMKEMLQKVSKRYE